MTDEIVKKLKESDSYFVIEQKDNVLIVGRITNMKLRIEKSGNIFQPFGKNIDKALPLFFPVILLKGKAKPKHQLISKFKEWDIPVLRLSKQQVTSSIYTLETIFNDYIEDNFRK